jgi:TPR repeat protein
LLHFRGHATDGEAAHSRFDYRYERDNAFFYLAIAYLEGKGVKKSLAMARKLLERANKDNDHPPAAWLLHRIAKESR